MICSGLPSWPWKTCFDASIDQSGALHELNSNWLMSLAPALLTEVPWMSTVMWVTVCTAGRLAPTLYSFRNRFDLLFDFSSAATSELAQAEDDELSRLHR